MMLTRAGVARRLRRSIATVRRMEGHELHPSQDLNGTHWFDPARGWLEAQQQMRRAGRSTAQRATPDADERALLTVIGERLSVVLVSLTARELSEIPEELLAAVTEVLEVAGY